MPIFKPPKGEGLQCVLSGQTTSLDTLANKAAANTKRRRTPYRGKPVHAHRFGQFGGAALHSAGRDLCVNPAGATPLL
jgi:hypothetical protein